MHLTWVGAPSSAPAQAHVRAASAMFGPKLECRNCGFTKRGGITDGIAYLRDSTHKVLCPKCGQFLYAEDPDGKWKRRAEHERAKHEITDGAASSQLETEGAAERRPEDGDGTITALVHLVAPAEPIRVALPAGLSDVSAVCNAAIDAAFPGCDAEASLLLPPYAPPAGPGPQLGPPGGGMMLKLRRTGETWGLQFGQAKDVVALQPRDTVDVFESSHPPVA